MASNFVMLFYVLIKTQKTSSVEQIGKAFRLETTHSLK